MRPEGGSEISTRCEIVVYRAIVKAVMTGHRQKRGIKERHRSQSPQCGLLQTEREQHNQFNHPRGILTPAQ